MSSTLGRLLLVVVLVCAGSTLLTAPAEAGTYEVDVCKRWQSGVANGLWWQLWEWKEDIHAWSIDGHCVGPGDEVKMQLPDGAAAHSEGYLEYPWIQPSGQRGQLRISGLTLFMYGDAGLDGDVQQGMRVCAATCGELIAPAVTREYLTMVTTSLNDPRIPANAYRVQLVGRCVTDEPCLGTRETRFQGMRVKFTDPVIPGSEIEAPDGLSDLSEHDSISTPHTIHWSATDADSGVSKIEARDAYFSLSGSLTERSVFEWKRCELQALNPVYPYCDTEETGVFTVDPHEVIDADDYLGGSGRDGQYLWKEGMHVVRFRVTDRSGNVHPGVNDVTFYVDRTAPELEDLWVEQDGAKFTHDWVSKPQITLGWKNSLEPLSHAEIDLVPLDGQKPPASQIVTGSQIAAASVSLPAPGEWSVSVRTYDQAGNRSQLRSATVGYDPSTPGTPAIDLPTEPWIGKDFLLTGGRLRWRAGEKPLSGLCGYKIHLGESITNVPGDVTDTLFPLPEMGEGEHVLGLAAVSCAGIQGDYAQAVIHVDLTPPRATSALVTGRWLSEEEPVELSGLDDQPSAGDSSGVRAIEVRAENGAWVSYPGDVAAPELDEGKHEIKFRAVDRAGNVSLEEELTVGIDRSAPAGWLLPADPARPTLINAIVTDPLSGFDDGTVEIRRAGTNDPWEPLETRVTTDGAVAAQLTARFPDTSRPEGRWAVRVRARDRVGHVAEIDRDVLGIPVEITTPVRSLPKLDAGFVLKRSRACRQARTRRCRSSLLQRQQVLSYGSSAIVRGVLRDASARGLAGRPVAILVRRERSAKRELLATVSTKSDGSFSARIPRGPNREITARFGGSEMERPVEVNRELLTRAQLSVRPSARRIKAGRTLRFDGRLSTGGEKIGVLGVDVVVRLAGTNIALVTKAGQDGRFVAEWTVPTTIRDPLRLRFVATVRHQTGWPFHDGRSRTVRVVAVPKQIRPNSRG